MGYRVFKRLLKYVFKKLLCMACTGRIGLEVYH